MISKDLKIEIRPIPGRSRIKEFSENLEYFSQAHVIPCLVDPVSLKYDTGLSAEDIEMLKEKNFPYNIDDNYVKGVAHEFWESQLLKVELRNNPMFLFPGRNPLDFCRWKYLLKSKYVYSSEAEMMTGSKSEATHYIYNESTEINLKAARLEKQNRLVRELGEQTLTRKRDLLLIIEDEITDNKDENYLTVKFDEILKNKDKADLLERLLKTDLQDLTLTADIKRAVQKNVLKRTKKGYFFFESNLGYSESDVKEFLAKDENQEILLTIKSKIQ